MNKTNKVRKGEVRIYGGKTYVAIPEIKEDHCAGCCFYNEGCCSIRDFDHIDFPDCHNSGMIWIESLNRLAKKWEKDGKRLWLYSASGVLTVMMHGDREDNPIPEMLPNAGTNPDNIITTISGIGNDGGDW